MVRRPSPLASPGNPVRCRGPDRFIDEYFDVAQTTGEAQREVAKNVAEATQSRGETLRRQVRSVGHSEQR
jgi:hypothetical protein